MLVRLPVVAAALLLVATGCGSHDVADRSKAAMAAMTQCRQRLDRELHVAPARTASEGFVRDLGNGRLRVTGRVPPGAGLSRDESYTCTVAPGSSGPRVVSFEVKRTT